MINKKYKAVVIGCGKIGSEEYNYQSQVRPATHAAAYKNNSKTRLVALVDINPEKLKRASKYFPGVSLFSSAEEMFQKIKPDIVSISTHPDSHLYLVKLATSYKAKAIVCEKPIATTIKDAENIIGVCKKNKTLLFINHQRRFDPLLRKWQAKIKDGLIGKIIQGSCYYYNGLSNNGTHVINLLQFFLGEISWVRAMINKETSWKEDDEDADVLIGFKSGTVITMQALSKNYVFLDLYFFGKKGRVSIKNITHTIEYQKLIKNKYYKGYYLLSGKIKKIGEARSFMQSMVKNVVGCLDNREKPYSTGEDALDTLKVILAIKKSTEDEGKVVTL